MSASRRRRYAGSQAWTDCWTPMWRAARPFRTTAGNGSSSKPKPRHWQVSCAYETITCGCVSNGVNAVIPTRTYAS
ncbi:prepilin-type N-terminal cleavage/methylation domain-containing protein [Halomonas sp. S2151]|uniref:prepilin-type N-terminal cleavage/methylation domain-containing protein n=1 Tax=Halomonas sp. S2151 TaxID=579478 RepID=UPI00406CF955